MKHLAERHVPMNSSLSDNTNNPVPNETPGISFSALALQDTLLSNLASLGYEQMTPIQAHGLPIMLDGKDVIAEAKTGSGKTAAFGLAVLNRLVVSHFAVQALILCPTRELAEQVSQALRRLARLMPNVKVLNVSGGMPIKPQVESLKHGTHIIVGTPGRVQKHIDQGTLTLNDLQMLVLDEADRMLDMGFFDAIKNVIKHCPKKRQTWLFSATYPKEIKVLATQFMMNPERLVIEDAHTELDIVQNFYEVTYQSNKYAVLKAVLLHYQPSSTLVFCNTKEQTTQLVDVLVKEGFSAIALNGDMEQIERDVAMIRFVNQSASILVATDVAARGLDIKELPMVINFDVAHAFDIHVHRIGRTGRAGSKGLALSITTPADAERLLAIEAGQGAALSWATVSALTSSNSSLLAPSMAPLCLSAGRKDKIRPGDVLGALTKDAGLPASAIGKIDVTALYSYVAISQSEIDKAYRYLQQGKLKGRKVSVKKLR